jgi:hypothetical protein
VTGAVIGLVVKQDSNFGGYSSKARRYIRLGHIACAALGMINVLAALSTKVGFAFPPLSLALLALGLVSMPLACWFHAATDKGYAVFPIPSLSLISAVVVFFASVGTPT